MSFDKTIHLPVTADEAFALVTEPERLHLWQTVAAWVDLRVGGEYRWTVTPGHHASGTFQEIEPGKRIVFTWGWESGMDLAPGGSTVTQGRPVADAAGVVDRGGHGAGARGRRHTVGA